MQANTVRAIGTFRARRQHAGIAAALALALVSGGCASSGPKLPDFMAGSEPPPAAPASLAQVPETPQSELEKATAYWGEEFSKKPTALEPALSYARNLKALGRKKQAMAILQQASAYHSDSRELASEYGRLALDLDQVSVAEKVLAVADDPAKPDWRIISARGTVLAKQGKYKEAIPHFERALAFAHDHPSVLNNLALAHAMTGEPQKAEELLRRAAAGGGSTARVRQNLALVLGLQGKYEESTKVAAQDQPPSVAAADTAVLRKIVQLDPVAPARSTTQLAEVPKSAAPAAAPAGGQPLRGTTTAVSEAATGWDSRVAEAKPAAGSPPKGTDGPLLRGSRR
ncbi:MAG: tetratricopeptide repeat protein [Hyphomicrobiaceae bacterium]|nr:tetratricopeptide repeat protein [Hyphomicrobiaceae bacterium]